MRPGGERRGLCLWWTLPAASLVEILQPSSSDGFRMTWLRRDFYFQRTCTVRLAKKVFRGRADDAGGTLVRGAVAIAADHHRRNSLRLAHRQTGGSRQFISHGENRSLQRFRVAV